jgi:hypothetical protein
MAEHRSERVVTETDGGGPPMRSGPNPGLIVGAILIALLIIGMVAYGMSNNSGDDDGGDGGDRVEVTVPDGSDDDGDAPDAGTEDEPTETTEGESTETTEAP